MSNQLELENMVMLVLVTYIFMLRMPSEALPMTRGDVGVASTGQSWLYLDGDSLCLQLKRRKNKPEGSLLKRTCWSVFLVHGVIAVDSWRVLG